MFHADLQWWRAFMSVFNGTVFFDQQAKQHVYVDAYNMATGAFCQGDWMYTLFCCDMPAAQHLHINYNEVCAVVEAVSRRAPFWYGKSVTVHTDSTVTKLLSIKDPRPRTYT